MPLIVAMICAQSVCHRWQPSFIRTITLPTHQSSLESPNNQSLIITRHLFGGWFGRKKTDKSVDKLPTIMAVDEPPMSTLTDDEIMAIRDKSSRLPPLVRAQLTLRDIPSIKHIRELRIPRVRQRYALYGRASGLKPGVMWPAKDELQWLKGYEKVFCKPLDQMIDETRQRRQREADERTDRVREVLANLKKLPKMKAEFWAKHNQMYRQKDEEMAKKDKLVQEVKEFVGYDLDPSDPRFEEALIKRDEELKRILKTQRKQDKQKQTLERLQALANEALEREQLDQQQLDNTTKPTDTTTDPNSKQQQNS